MQAEVIRAKACRVLILMESPTATADERNAALTELIHALGGRTRGAHLRADMVAFYITVLLLASR
jgi:hypothetical protein